MQHNRENDENSRAAVTRGGKVTVFCDDDDDEGNGFSGGENGIQRHYSLP